MTDPLSTNAMTWRPPTDITDPSNALRYMLARTPKFKHDAAYRYCAGTVRAALVRLAAYDAIVGAIRADLIARGAWPPTNAPQRIGTHVSDVSPEKV